MRLKLKRRFKLLLAAGILPAAAFAWGDDAVSSFKQDIRPALEKYCFDCHDSGGKKAGVDLEQFDSMDSLWRDPKLWERVLVQLRERVMPPAKKPQPADEQRVKLASWVAATLDHPDESKLPRDPGRTVIHRLSRLEYNNTVHDLLGVEIRPADEFPPDGGGGGGFDNNAGTLFIPPILMEKLLSAADEIIRHAKPERLFVSLPKEGVDERTAARQSLADLARRAFRRPVEAREIDRLLGLYDATRQRGGSHEDGVKLAAKAILVSPYFLFRIEPDRDASGPFQLGDFELASRLSYFLWSSMPDEELFHIAGEGHLHEPQVLETQVRRMLADAKAHAFAENFATQWLRTKELKTIVSPAPDKFPQYTPALRDAFYAESVEFFDHLLKENRPILDCLDCDYTYANETLAKFYSLPEIKGDEMRRVSLSDHNRGGLLGMGGILSLTSYPRRTSPVLRGKWVMEEILGTPPPPPPPMVNTEKLGSEHPQDGLTFRQRLEQHRQDPKCAGCHARMDPLGFGLENFSAIGGWRTDVSGAPLDASGQMVTGEKFTGPAEMKRLLLDRKEEFTRNLTEKMLSYALGRGLESADWWPVRQIASRVAADGYHAQTLVIEIVRSFPFQYRRPGAPQTVASSTP